jgi:hypothetical protein
LGGRTGVPLALVGVDALDASVLTLDVVVLGLVEMMDNLE